MATRKPTTNRGTFIQQSRDVPPGRKALYHDEVGAGRSRVLRPFFQLTASDEEWLVREIEARLDRRLSAQ